MTQQPTPSKVVLSRKRRQIAIKARKKSAVRNRPQLPYKPDDVTVDQIRSAVDKVVSV